MTVANSARSCQGRNDLRPLVDAHFVGTGAGVPEVEALLGFPQVLLKPVKASIVIDGGRGITLADPSSLAKQECTEAASEGGMRWPRP